MNNKMNRIKELMPTPWTFPYPDRELYTKEQMMHFAKSIVEETLKEVDECCYGRGENSWYYEEDKKWIRMYFGV